MLFYSGRDEKLKREFTVVPGNILLILCCVCMIVCIMLYCFIPDFVVFAKQQHELVAQTILYLRLEMLALNLGIIASFFIVVAIIRNDRNLKAL